MLIIISTRVGCYPPHRFVGNEEYFYLFGNGNCEYAMADVSIHANPDDLIPKCTDIIKQNPRGGRSDMVILLKLIMNIVNFLCNHFQVTFV